MAATLAGRSKSMRETQQQANLWSETAGSQSAALHGLRIVPGYLGRPAQKALLAALREVIAQAPLYTPRMPRSGKPMSVRMTNCGALGWITDERGYRYQPTHPETGARWPPMPELVLKAWAELARYPHPPEACLINFYGPAARMGLHQDRDEADFSAPVVSLSLGDTCLFRIGGTKRGDPLAYACFRRCARARRRGAARLPRRRPHYERHLDAAAGGRTDQPDAATGDAPCVMPRRCLRAAEPVGIGLS